MFGIGPGYWERKRRPLLATLAFICFQINYLNADGQKPVLRVLTFYDPSARQVAKQVHNFEHASNCWVEWDFRYQYELEQVILSDLSSYDVVAIDEPWIPKLSSSLLPVKKWPNDHSGVKPQASYFLSEFNELGRWNDLLYGKPLVVNFYLYAYRLDIFENPLLREKYLERYGTDLEPPTDYAAFLELVRFFHEQTDYSGFAPVSRRSESMLVDFFWLLAMEGVQLNSLSDMNSLDVAKLEAAMRAYVLLHQSRPEGAEDWFVEEVNSAYVLGEVPHIFQWQSLLSPLRDPLFSKLGSATGFRSLPAANSSPLKTISGAWFLALPAAADIEKRALAVSFVNWMQQQMPVTGLETTKAVTVDSYSSTEVLMRPKLENYYEFSAMVTNELTELIHGNVQLEAAAIELARKLEAFARTEAQLNDG